jgi:hypothetical protein
MNRGARGVPGARGEAAGGLAELGLPLNFNTNLLQEGLCRFVTASSPRPPGTPRPPRFMRATSEQGPRQCDWLPRTTGETPGLSHLRR